MQENGERKYVFIQHEAATAITVNDRPSQTIFQEY
jgi:hypothetical protein